MARAFAIQYNHRFNVKPASKFGEITYLYTDSSSPPMANPQVILEETMERLDRFNFNPKVDFVIFSGTIINVTLFVTAVMLLYGEAKLLCYDAVTHSYFERHIRDINEEETATAPNKSATV